MSNTNEGALKLPGAAIGILRDGDEIIAVNKTALLAWGKEQAREGYTHSPHNGGFDDWWQSRVEGKCQTP